jgi:hypothetical protein
MSPRRRRKSSESGGAGLVSQTVPLLTPEQAEKSTNPWILLKVKALGELIPAAGLMLETGLDQSREPHEISLLLLKEYDVRLSDLEVARYGAWLPHLRRDEMRRAEERAERNVQEARERAQRRQ